MVSFYAAMLWLRLSKLGKKAIEHTTLATRGRDASGKRKSNMTYQSALKKEEKREKA
jgi:hypothetical protein